MKYGALEKKDDFQRREVKSQVELFLSLLKFPMSKKLFFLISFVFVPFFIFQKWEKLGSFKSGRLIFGKVSFGKFGILKFGKLYIENLES